MACLSPGATDVKVARVCSFPQFHTASQAPFLSEAREGGTIPEPSFRRSLWVERGREGLLVEEGRVRSSEFHSDGDSKQVLPGRHLSQVSCQD